MTEEVQKFNKNDVEEQGKHEDEEQVKKQDTVEDKGEDKEEVKEEDPQKEQDKEQEFNKVQELLKILSERTNMILDLQIENENLKSKNISLENDKDIKLKYEKLLDEFNVIKDDYDKKVLENEKEKENKKKQEQSNKIELLQLKTELELNGDMLFLYDLLSLKSIEKQKELFYKFMNMPNDLIDYKKYPDKYPLFDYLNSKYNIENNHREKGNIFVVTDNMVTSLFNDVLDVKDFDKLGNTFTTYIKNNMSDLYSEVAELKGLTTIDGHGNILKNKKKNNKLFRRIVK